MYFSNRVFEEEKKTTKKIIISSNRFDLILSVLKNGGVISGFSEKIIISVPSQELNTKFVIIEKQWFKLQKAVNTLIKEPVYTYISTPVDTVINNIETEIAVINSVKNSNVISAAKYINDNSNLLIDVNNNAIYFLENRTKNNKLFQNVVLILSIIIYIILSFLLILIFNKNVVLPIKFINSTLKNIINRETGLKIDSLNIREFENISENLKKIVENNEDISNFVKNLKDNNLKTALPSYNKNSKLDTGLISLRDILNEKLDAEKKRIHEEKLRNWASQGHAKFNTLLRNTSLNIQSLTDSVIKNLVTFLDSSQGGLFIVNEKDKNNLYVELISAFAYDRKKYFVKKIPFGEGLIGTCALEKNTIWLNDVPRNYMDIESGLGEAPPKSLLIVPLKTETELLGIIELASFNDFKKNEVEFVENLANNIASSLETTKISERTRELLTDSQKKSEELASRDAEMRLKINELRKIQELAKKNETEISTLVTAVDNTLIKIEISKRAKIITANKMLLVKTDYHSGELINKNFSLLISDNETENFKKILNKVFLGETIKKTICIFSKYGKEIWILAHFTPLRDQNGKVRGVLTLGNDITVRKETENKNEKLLLETIDKAKILAEKEELMQKNYNKLIKTQNEIIKKEIQERALLSAIDDNFIKAEYDINGIIISANKKFTDALKYDKEQIKNKNIRDIIPKGYLHEFEEIWKTLILGNSFQETVKLQDNNKNTLWWLTSFTPVNDKEKKIIKILFLANDVSKQKNAEEKIKQQSKALKEQEIFLTENMEEMMEDNEKTAKKLEKLTQREIKITQKYETQEDTKYELWLNDIGKQ